MRLTIPLFLLLLVSPVIAGTSVFRIEGDTLTPLHEEELTLNYQTVRVERDGNFMNVNVWLSFTHRSITERKLLLGFVAHPLSNSPPQTANSITDLHVTVNDKNSDYHVKRLPNSRAAQKLGYRGGEYVHLFEVVFNYDKNDIHYSYRLPLEDVKGIKTFAYNLQASRFWSPGSRQRFNLTIDLGPEAYFAVPAFLERDTDRWQHHGSVKIDTWISPEYTLRFRRVYAKKGSISFTARRFNPVTDLHIRIAESAYDFVRHFGERDRLDEIMTELVPEDINSNNARELRNLLYALHGYYFDSADIRDLYSNAYWYIPVDTQQINTIVFKKREGELLDVIHAVESIDRREFWRDYLLPLYENDFERIREFVAFPLDGAWEDLLEPPKRQNSGTIADLIANFDTIHRALIFERFADFNNFANSFSNNIIVYPGLKGSEPWIHVELREGEYSVRLHFERVNTEWKLVYLFYL